jgi:hypothetical protein
MRGDLEKRVDMLSVGIRFLGIEVHEEILEKIILTMDLINQKGENANLSDIISVKNELIEYKKSKIKTKKS